MMGPPTKECGEPPSPGLMFCRNSIQEVPQTELTKNIVKKDNARIMHVGDIILVAAVESVIDENWFLLDNRSACNIFINGKYLSNIRDAPYGQYLCVNFNVGVTHTNKIGELPEYSNPVCYNPRGIANILSLGLVQKNHLVTYNIQDVNEIFIHSPKRPIFKMNTAGIFYHDMRHLLNNKDANIVVRDLHSPIPQV